jgi:Transcription antiterminator
MLATPDRNWNEGYYVVRSIGKSDQHALDWLRRFRVETYYPMVLEMKKVPKKLLSLSQRRSGIEIKKPQIAPLFPRYIFARLGDTRYSWREIMTTASIGGMVCEGDMPIKVRSELIERIRARENNGAVAGCETVRTMFQVGDGVTVTDGPFASFPGIVERGLDRPIEDLDPQDRIKVAVNIFGRATPVELEIWQVSKH